MYYHCCSGSGGDLLDWLLVSFTFASLRFLLSEEIKAELQQEIPCTQVFLVIPWIVWLVGRSGLGWDGLESKWFSLTSTTHWHSVSSEFVLSKGWEILLSWATSPASSDNSIVLFKNWGWKTGFIWLSWLNALNLKNYYWILLDCDLSCLNKEMAYSTAPVLQPAFVLFPFQMKAEWAQPQFHWLSGRWIRLEGLKMAELLFCEWTQTKQVLIEELMTLCWTVVVVIGFIIQISRWIEKKTTLMKVVLSDLKIHDARDVPCNARPRWLAWRKPHWLPFLAQLWECTSPVLWWYDTAVPLASPVAAMTSVLCVACSRGLQRFPKHKICHLPWAQNPPNYDPWLGDPSARVEYPGINLLLPWYTS